MENKKIDAEEIILASKEKNNEVQPQKEINVSEADLPTLAKKVNSETAREIIELRAENKKVFENNDGTKKAIFYSTPVHRFNKENNQFEETDYTLYEDAEGKHYINDKNKFTASFSNEDDNDELFSIKQDEFEVVVCAKKSSKQKNKGVKPEIKEKEGKKAQRAIFSNVVSGNDYEYSLSSTGIKENIIVNKRKEIYRYSFILKQKNLTSIFDEENKIISFVKKGTKDEVFYIPAPFMYDAVNESSNAVFYELKNGDKDEAVLNIIADSEWINDNNRVLPVVIDPQILLRKQGQINMYQWADGKITVGEHVQIGLVQKKETTDCGSSNVVDVLHRGYVSIPVPTLPNNPRIKKVELKLYRLNETESQNIDQMIGIYEVTEDIVVGTCTPKFDSTIKGYIRIDKDSESNLDKDFSYNCFDITSIFEKAIDSGKEKIDLLLKDIDETNGNTYISVSAPVVGAAYNPELMITYESSYAVNESYRTHTHQLGRFGQGSIDLQCGNLMFECEDFAWLGNRMPVTIKHLYNSAISDYQYTDNANIALNVADFSAMKIGKGFKLNLMQGIRHIDNYTGEDGKEYDKEVFVDESGKEIYLITDHELYSEYGNINCLRGEEGSEEDFVYDPPMNIATRGDEKYYFDDKLRVNKIEDKDGNTITINYTSDRISSVTDGAGRDFIFTYNSNGFLMSICAPGDDDNVTIISYEYSGEYLSGITYPDGRKVVITYESSKPKTVTLFDQNGVAVYKVEYLFNGDKVQSVTEYGVENGVFVKGASSTYACSIAANRTTVTTTEVADSAEENDNVIKTVYCFDDDGNVISEYAYSEDTGNDAVSGSGSGINPYLSDGGVKIIRNVINLIKDGNFECACKETGESNFWTATSNVVSPSSAMPIKSQDYSEFGRCCMEIISKDPDASALGVYQQMAALPAGEYTFSCYVKPETDIIGNPYNNLGAYIRVVDAQNNIIAESEHLTNKESSYYRLILPFTLTSSQEIKVMLLVNGCGEVLFDGAQLENNPFASEFNMIENASFEEEYAWEKSFGNGKTTYAFDGESVMILPGNIDLRRQGKQTIYPRLSKDVRETFTLSGWAKGSDCLPNRKDEEYSPQFRLKAKLYYADKTESEEAYADFSPCCDEWQYTSVQFSKSKYAELSKIEVVCEYNYNSGSALFDSIQLVRDSVETGLSEGEFGTGGGSGYSGDNVDTTKAEFTESVDGYGNTLTETTYFDGELGTIYRSFEFDADYNNLTKEVDARGNETTYTVDAETSRNEEIEDRLGNKTAYEYDAAGRTTKVTSKNSSNEVLAHVGYSYDAFDNMTEIVRGDGMKYMLKYNAFHNLESIGIDGKNDGDLIKYTYKNGNGRLKEITYANGDKMKASYNSIGQMIAEKWFDKLQNVTAFYKYVYDNNGNIVRSVDISGKKEYDYVYKDSKIVTATEYAIQVDTSEMITSKTVVSAARYYYDGEDKLLKKIITFANGKQSEIYYQHGENDAQAVKNIVNGKPVTSHSNTDSFGRKEFDELQLGTKSVWRKFNYHAGEVTQEHISAEKVKSTPTTQLVSKIEFSDGRELLYEYDAEERITKVIDKQQEISTTTEYTYDALGQLLEEKVNGELVNKMTYDTYGNIYTKNGVEYSYCDGIWKDKLTGVGEQTITYDAQGNPISYLGHTLTWEKGRQLKSFDNITYTYNANGIRTSKTVNGVKHEYILDGTKVLCEEWNGNTLIPMYDNEDSVCGIIYNDEPYYFTKNLQGDIITIVDKNAQTVAKYSYDAWGVCDVTFDCTAVGIAAINPYRYRGYFFDKETELYYLQSRYYNASVGRFVNGDDAQYVNIEKHPQKVNILAYCDNNPVNESDSEGSVITAILRKILLGFIKGFLKQLCSDILVWLVRKVVFNKHEKFRLKIEEYIASILEGIFSEFSLFQAIGSTIKIICIVVKYLPKLFGGRMRGSDWGNLLLEIIAVFINILFNAKLSKIKTQRNLLAKKRVATSNIKIQPSISQLTVKIRVFNVNLQTAIPITQTILSFIISVLCE